MSIFNLPTGEGRDSLRTDITRSIEFDGVLYDLRFRYNTRDESWTLICSRSGGLVIFSTKATCGRLLTEAYKYREYCPQGDMFILDISEENGRADFDNFTITGRYRLFYNSVT